MLPRNRREWLIAAAAGLVVLLGAVIFEWWEDSPSRPWAVPMPPTVPV